MSLLKGKEAADALCLSLKEKAAEAGIRPCLAIVRVGERPDDLSYERGALKRAAALGFDCQVRAFPAEISQDAFMAEFRKINGDPGIHGVLLFRPLPGQLDDKAVLEALDPLKDVDGLCRENLAKVFAGDPDGFAPCTAAAVMAMLDFAGVELRGRRAVVVGRSLVVGKPLAMLLLGRDATVTVCHSKTRDLPAVCREADILVACVGRAGLITGDYVKEGAVVMDVGINVDAEGKLKGDVDFASVEPKAKLITPVPGGVGTMTTSILAAQTLKAALLSLSR